MREEDLEVTQIPQGKVGGQQVGVPITEIMVRHKPTGIYAVSKYERSQHRNRQVAKDMVEYGLAVIGWKD